MPRKPRPLAREIQHFRDDRIYIIACDDTYAPQQYFDCFTKDFLGKRMQIHVIPTTDGTSAAEHVLDRLLEVNYESYDERWLILDTDHYIEGSHQRSFQNALAKARQNDVKIAVSRPCFEFWLALHHLEIDSPHLSDITNASHVEAILKTLFNGFNKTKLCEDHFPLTLVPDAVRRAEVLDLDCEGGNAPKSNVTRVYKIWKSIVGNATLQQLPEELHLLKKSLSGLNTVSVREL